MQLCENAIIYRPAISPKFIIIYYDYYISYYKLLFIINLNRYMFIFVHVSDLKALGSAFSIQKYGMQIIF